MIKVLNSVCVLAALVIIPPGEHLRADIDRYFDIAFMLYYYSI